MRGLWTLVRMSFTPITVMVVPHSMSRFVRLRISLAIVYFCCITTAVALVYMVYLSANTLYYYQSRLRLNTEFREVKASLASLQRTENEFRGLFALAPRQPIAAGLEPQGDAVDTENIKKQIRQAIDSMSDIRQYLNKRRDAFLATPAGLPVSGHISSPFGPRRHPVTGKPVFHHGVDIGTPKGIPVRATADGIVSYSGWTAGSGNLVVVEHGFGYETIYAHGSERLVAVRQVIKRGDPVIVSGATGVTTGPHVHYEVWRGGRQVDPLSSIEER